MSVSFSLFFVRKTSRLKKTGFHDILYHELELIYGGIVKWDIVYF